MALTHRPSRAEREAPQRHTPRLRYQTPHLDRGVLTSAVPRAAAGRQGQAKGPRGRPGHVLLGRGPRTSATPSPLHAQTHDAVGQQKPRPQAGEGERWWERHRAMSRGKAGGGFGKAGPKSQEEWPAGRAGGRPRAPSGTQRPP